MNLMIKNAVNKIYEQYITNYGPKRDDDVLEKVAEDFYNSNEKYSDKDMILIWQSVTKKLI